MAVMIKDCVFSNLGKSTGIALPPGTKVISRRNRFYNSPNAIGVSGDEPRVTEASYGALGLAPDTPLEIVISALRKFSTVSTWKSCERRRAMRGTDLGSWLHDRRQIDIGDLLERWDRFLP